MEFTLFLNGLEYWLVKEEMREAGGFKSLREVTNSHTRPVRDGRSLQQPSPIPEWERDFFWIFFIRFSTFFR